MRNAENSLNLHVARLIMVVPFVVCKIDVAAALVNVFSEKWSTTWVTKKIEFYASSIDIISQNQWTNII